MLEKYIQNDTQQPNFSMYIVSMVSDEDFWRWEFNVYDGRLKSQWRFFSSEFKFQGLWGTLQVLQTQIFRKSPHHNNKAKELQPSTPEHVFA